MTVTPYQILFQSHNKKGAMKGVGARVEKKRTAQNILVGTAEGEEYWKTKGQMGV